MGLPEDVEAEYQEAFECYSKDKDGNDKGYITPDEYISALRMCGQNPSQKQVEELKKEAGSKIKVDYFLKVMESKHGKPRDPTMDDVMECFQMFDKDGNGYLTVQEFKHILTNLGDKFTEEEWAEVEKDIDDGSGMVSYGEFTKMALAG